MSEKNAFICFLAALAVYVCVGAVTFGQVAARLEKQVTIADPFGAGAIAAIGWPIYWPFRLSYSYFSGVTP